MCVSVLWSLAGHVMGTLYLEVLHGGYGALGGASAMPLVQCVLGLGAEGAGCLLLLQVLDEGHGAVGAGQVVPTWGRDTDLGGGGDQNHADHASHSGAHLSTHTVQELCQ